MVLDGCLNLVICRCSGLFGFCVWLSLVFCGGCVSIVVVSLIIVVIAG